MDFHYSVFCLLPFSPFSHPTSVDDFAYPGNHWEGDWTEFSQTVEVEQVDRNLLGLW